MRNVSGIIAGLSGENIIFTYMISLKSPAFTVFRICDWSQDLWFAPEGQYYKTTGIELNPIRYGGGNVIDSLSFRVNDVNKDIYNSLIGMGPTRDEMNQFEITVRLATLSSNYLVSSYSTIFAGTIDSWTFSPPNTSISSVSFFERLRHSGNRISSSSCTVKVFKGIGCYYSGPETSCDRVYQTCKNYGNSDNFRGFRWLPTLADKQIRFS